MLLHGLQFLVDHALGLDPVEALAGNHLLQVCGHALSLTPERLTLLIQLVSQNFQLGPLPHIQGQLLTDPLHHVGTPLGGVLTPPVRSARAMPTPGSRPPETACRCSGSHQDHGRQANQNAFDSHDVTSSGSAGPWRHLVGSHVCPDPVMPGRTGIQHVWAELPEAR